MKIKLSKKYLQHFLRCPVHNNIRDPSNTNVEAMIMSHLIWTTEAGAQYCEDPVSGILYNILGIRGAKGAPLPRLCFAQLALTLLIALSLL